MKMNIEEKKENFLALLRSCCISQGEQFKLSSKLLEENGLSYKDLSDVICPEFEKRGILKNYRLLATEIRGGNYFNMDEHERDLSLLAEERRLASDWQMESIEDRQKELKKKLDKHLKSLDSLYGFEVCGDKLFSKELDVNEIVPETSKEKIYRLEFELKTLDNKEEDAVFSYMQGIKGRGVTKAGAKPHIDGIRRKHKEKKRKISQELNEALYQDKISDLKKKREVKDLDGIEANSKTKQSFERLDYTILEEIVYVLDRIYKKGERANFKAPFSRCLSDSFFPPHLVDSEDRQSLLDKISEDSGGAIKKATVREPLSKDDYSCLERTCDGFCVEDWGEFKKFREKIKNKTNKLKEKDCKDKKQKDVPIDWLEIKEKKSRFKFDKDTGDCELNDTRWCFTPKSQEYNFILTLINDKNYQSDYLTLIKAVLSPSIEVKNVSKAHKLSLATIIRNIKKALGILPKQRRSKIGNENIFINKRNFGYRIVIK